MEKVLLMLAGYPGVGKSTLLHTALEQHLPIFGRKHDAGFQATRPPAKLPEWSVSGPETLQQGTWFSEIHIPFLTQLPELPAFVVLHLDLITLSAPASSQVPPELARHLPRTVENLADAGLNEQIFRHFFANPLFNRFDRVVSSTLYSPWATVARQWRKRQAEESRPAHRIGLFDFDHPRLDIHEAIHQGWLRALRALDPELSLLCEQKEGGRLTVKRIKT